MSPQEIKQIFDAQCDNVRELKSAWTHVNITINQALKEDNDKQLTFQTRMLGLIFCAYSEATFLKVIHTDKKFSSDEIEQIKVSAKRSIVEGWKKCLKLALRKVDAKKSNHVPNVQQKTLSLIKDYIEEPSLIRNKIAHGQWHTALNRKNTEINQDLTHKIQNLTVIDLTKYRAAFDRLSAIIEDIIESLIMPTGSSIGIMSFSSNKSKRKCLVIRLKLKDHCSRKRLDTTKFTHNKRSRPQHTFPNPTEEFYHISCNSFLSKGKLDRPSLFRSLLK